MGSDIALKIAEVAARKQSLRVAYLFGSQVNGTAGAGSDLDIAVRWTYGLTEVERMDAQLDFVDSLTESLGPLGEKADIVDMDQASSAVAFRAVSEGLCVFASSDAERVDAIVRTCRRYDDDAPMRELFRLAAIAAVAKMKTGTHG